MRDIEDDPEAETIQTYMARMTKVLFFICLHLHGSNDYQSALPWQQTLSFSLKGSHGSPSLHRGPVCWWI